LGGQTKYTKNQSSEGPGTIDPLIRIKMAVQPEKKRETNGRKLQHGRKVRQAKPVLTVTKPTRRGKGGGSSRQEGACWDGHGKRRGSEIAVGQTRKQKAPQSASTRARIHPPISNFLLLESQKEKGSKSDLGGTRGNDSFRIEPTINNCWDRFKKEAKKKIGREREEINRQYA